MAEEQWIPENKHELMSAIKHEWQRLMDVVAKLESANKLTTTDEGGWSPKDNLAHLAEWMNAMMGYHMDRRPRHEVMRVSEEVTKDWDFNVINPVLFERNKNRSTQDVLGELNQVYESLIKKLESMPFEDLLKARHADDPEKRPLLLWVLGDTTEHFAEHRETIEKML
jgi:hypothetical protein